MLNFLLFIEGIVHLKEFIGMFLFTWVILIVCLKTQAVAVTKIMLTIVVAFTIFVELQNY